MNTPLPSSEKPASHPKKGLILTSLFAAAAMNACSNPKPNPEVRSHSKVVETVTYTRTLEVQGNATFSGYPKTRAVDRACLEAVRGTSVDPWTARELEIIQENHILRQRARAEETRRSWDSAGY